MRFIFATALVLLHCSFPYGNGDVGDASRLDSEDSDGVPRRRRPMDRADCHDDEALKEMQLGGDGNATGKLDKEALTRLCLEDLEIQNYFYTLRLPESEQKAARQSSSGDGDAATGAGAGGLGRLEAMEAGLRTAMLGLTAALGVVLATSAVACYCQHRRRRSRQRRRRNADKEEQGQQQELKDRGDLGAKCENERKDVEEGDKTQVLTV